MAAVAEPDPDADRGRGVVSGRAIVVGGGRVVIGGRGRRGDRRRTRIVDDAAAESDEREENRAKSKHVLLPAKRRLWMMTVLRYLTACHPRAGSMGEHHF